VAFHHSNTRLPRVLEENLRLLVMTPRLHGIHHSIVDEERDSNFSSGLSQKAITIGLASHRRKRDVTAGKVMLLPFRGTKLARETKRIVSSRSS
jgi:hypothetical protein